MSDAANETRSWSVAVGGRTFVISAEKSFDRFERICIDGVATGKRLGPDDREQIVPVGGALYVVRRSESSTLELAPYVRPAPQTLGARSPGQVRSQAAAGRTGTVPKSQPRNLAALLWAGVAIAVAILLWLALGPSYERQASARVAQMLKEMSAGTGAEAQRAVGIWVRNVPNLSDRDELSWASDHFDNWRMQRDLYHKFSTWDVVSSTRVEGTEVPTAMVTVRIEGREMRMVVPERRPISWAP